MTYPLDDGARDDPATGPATWPEDEEGWGEHGRFEPLTPGEEIVIGIAGGLLAVVVIASVIASGVALLSRL